MKHQPVVVITGANGFLGTHLVDHFVGRGWRVIALVRGAKRYRREGVTYVEYDLYKSVDEGILRDVDYLVHAAYIKADRTHPDAVEANISGAERIVAASRKHGLKKNVFISSMSAHDSAISAYGRQKLQIEQLFNAPQDVVLRPGLIIGNGGIVKNMVRFMQSKHMVPLVDGGKQPLQIIGVDDLVRAIELTLSKDIHGVLTVAHPHAYTYKQFYQLLAKELKIFVMFVPVPYWLIMGVLKLLELVPYKAGIGTDNLRGLKKMQSVDTTADIRKLGITTTPLEACLETIRTR